MKPLLCILGAALLLSANLEAQNANLQVLNAAGTSSTITVAQGGTFSAEVLVTSLPSPLDSFDITFKLPTTTAGGLNLISYTNTVPAGWIPLSSGLDYGANNFSGNDITGSGELVLANFTVSSNTTPGTYSGTNSLTLDTSALLDLTGPPPDSIVIPFNTPIGATIVITAVPEPSTWALVVVGSILLAGASLRKLVRKLARQTNS